MQENGLGVLICVGIEKCPHLQDCLMRILMIVEMVFQYLGHPGLKRFGARGHAILPSSMKLGPSDDLHNRFLRMILKSLALKWLL
jgi:hypothetical protein